MTAVITEKTVKLVEVDWDALASAVETEVMEKLDDDLVAWQYDVSMKVMFLRDAADGLEVCGLLKEGKWKEVEERLWDMDTASRDHVYDWIEKHSCDNLFRLLREQ
jgi:hypothetical protein